MLHLRRMQSVTIPKKIPILTDGSLTLRELRPLDIKAWFKRAIDQESANLAGDEVPKDISEGKDWLRRHNESFKNKQSMRWSIDLAQGPKSVGTIELFNFNTSNQSAEIGYIIGREFWGRGIGTSAVRLVVEYAFTELHLDTIFAELLSLNVGSIKILKKIGFKLNREFKDAGDSMLEYELIKEFFKE